MIKKNQHLRSDNTLSSCLVIRGNIKRWRLADCAPSPCPLPSLSGLLFVMQQLRNTERVSEFRMPVRVKNSSGRTELPFSATGRWSRAVARLFPLARDQWLSRQVAHRCRV
jgi:hypothetical protein